MLLLGRALLFWLALFELIAGWRGWWGLSWLGRVRGLRLMLPLLVLPLLAGSRRWWARVLVLGVTLLPAFLAHIALSSLRNRNLNPLLSLLPGTYSDRTITPLQLPLEGGYLPALHVAPTTGATAALCVAHGSGSNKTTYAWRLVDLLVARGVAVLLIDMDGHGENPRVQRYPQILDNVQVAVSWLRERYQRVGLLGISLGGCVSVRAVADGLPVDGLIVLEAPPRLHFTRADVWREGAALARLELFYLFDNCTPYHMYRAWGTPGVRAAISTWDLIAKLDLCGSLPRVQVPLLLLYGKRDSIVKPAQAEQVRVCLPPGAEFHMVPGASHLTLLLTPMTMRTVDAWVQRVLR